MEDWQKDLFRALDTLAEEMDRVFLEVAQDVADATDLLIRSSEEAMEQLQVTVFEQVDRYFTDLVDPFLEILLDVGDDFDDNFYPVLHGTDPLLHNQPACVGCHHYHGQVYGGNLLVCAMHPLGWEGEKCPDWEGSGT